jgi:hypothetical protein
MTSVGLRSVAQGDAVRWRWRRPVQPIFTGICDSHGPKGQVGEGRLFERLIQVRYEVDVHVMLSGGTRWAARGGFDNDLLAQNRCHWAADLGGAH